MKGVATSLMGQGTTGDIMELVANKSDLGDGCRATIQLLVRLRRSRCDLRLYKMRGLAITILAFLALAIALRPHQFVPLPTKPMPAVSLPDK
jgi:hypothetical protein